jgi:hypothetical protein
MEKSKDYREGMNYIHEEVDDEIVNTIMRKISQIS